MKKEKKYLVILILSLRNFLILEKKRTTLDLSFSIGSDISLISSFLLSHVFDLLSSNLILYNTVQLQYQMLISLNIGNTICTSANWSVILDQKCKEYNSVIMHLFSSGIGINHAYDGEVIFAVIITATVPDS